MKATREREIKLGAGPRFRLPDLPGERLPPVVLTSVYLDTVDHRLALAGVTLRRRLEGGRSRWQLKLPRGDARLELELPDERRGSRGRRHAERDTPPGEMIDLVTAYTRGAALTAVATLRSRRQKVVVRDFRGPVAEAVLDSVHVLNGHATLKRFREVEVELTGGDEAALRSIEQTLRAAGATDGDGRPKLLRALGIEAVPPPSPPEPSATPAEHLRAMIEAQRALLIAHDAGTRLGTDAESLHQMRVACRRLRALLREARSMLEPEWVQALRAELEWLGDELGAVRDLDVLRQRLSDDVATLDPADARGGARLVHGIEAERDRVRDGGLLPALRSPRYLALLGALDDAARQPPIVDADVSLVSIARDAFKRLDRAVRELGEEPANEAVHAVRIMAKRARYAAELAAPVSGKPAERFIERAKDFQDLLGEFQDGVVAQQRLRELAGRSRTAAPAFVAGQLVARRATRRAEILRQLPKRWRKLQKRGSKAWR
jgi:CHAD domain-containing protein